MSNHLSVPFNIISEFPFNFLVRHKSFVSPFYSNRKICSAEGDKSSLSSLIWWPHDLQKNIHSADKIKDTDFSPLLHPYML